jgi:hypothetical protein
VQGPRAVEVEEGVVAAVEHGGHVVAVLSKSGSYTTPMARWPSTSWNRSSGWNGSNTSSSFPGAVGAQQGLHAAGLAGGTGMVCGGAPQAGTGHHRCPRRSRIPPAPRPVRCAVRGRAAPR